MTGAHNCSQEEPMAPGQVITRWVNHTERFLPILSIVWSPLASCWKVYWIDGAHRLQNVNECRYLCSTWRRCLRVYNEFMSSWKHFFTGCHPQRMPPGMKGGRNLNLVQSSWFKDHNIQRLDKKMQKYVKERWAAHVVREKNMLLLASRGRVVCLRHFSDLQMPVASLICNYNNKFSICFLSSSICLSETAQICI